MRLIILSFFCVSTLYCAADTSDWISLDKTLPNKSNALTKEILQSDSLSYKVKIKIQGLYNNVVETDEGTFYKISLGEGNLCSIGNPALPTFSQHIAIPEGAGVTYKIEEESWTDVTVGQIYPAQKMLMEGEKAQSFVYNDKSYKKPFVPEKVVLSPEMEWRGIRSTCIVVCPFRYYPQEGRLSVLKEFVMSFDFPKGRVPVFEKAVYEGHDPFHLYDNNIFPERPPQRNATLTYGNSEYAPNNKLLIIVGSGLNSILTSTKMDEFCKWKALKGYPVEVVSTTTTGIDSTSIKNYIYQKYVNDDVRYVLFVGDCDQIPMHIIMSRYDYPSVPIFNDYWYGCMGGTNDILADVSVGRFSTNSLQEFGNMVDKTIRYERSFHALNNAILVANYEGAPDPDSFQDCCDTIRGHNYLTPMTFVTAYGASPAYQGNAATNSDVVNYINQGANIINYRGHGSVDYWGGTGWGTSEWNVAGDSLSSSELSSIADNTNSVFFSIACNTGNILASCCMLEAFTRSPRGAVAFIGATKTVETTNNSRYNRALFLKLLDSGVYQLGDLNVAAHAKCISWSGYGEISIDIAYSYLLGGDPTLELWTSAPHTFENVNFSISGSNCSLTANIYDGFEISVLESNYYHRLYQHFSYNGGTFLKPYFNFYVVLHKHNYFPYIIYGDFTTNLLEVLELNNDAYYYATPITIHDGIAEDGSSSGVIVKSGNKLFIKKGTGGVTITNTFDCEEGASFVIE